MKIYLTKSNQANPDDLINARAAIKKEGNSIVEYIGGKYDNTYTPIKESGGVVVIAPAQNEIIKQDDVDFIYVGKGNFSEINAHIKYMKEHEQTPSVRLFKGDKFFNVIKISVVETNWQLTYAKLYLT